MEFIKGTLDVLIMKALSWGPQHGYAVSRWIRARSGERFTLSQGALYPALRRLESRGFLASKWTVSETGRDVRTYHLTDTGQDHLDRSIRDWVDYVDAMGRILQSTEFDA